MAQLGMVGLGRMGAGIVRRLMRDGHGYLHCGGAGADHFVKMVHNGIEYGVMAAYAEGLNVLHRANAGKEQAQTSAEIAPLRDPEYYQYNIDVPEVAELWRRGSVLAFPGAAGAAS